MPKRKRKLHEFINNIEHKHCYRCDQWKVLDQFRKFEVDDKIQLLEGLFEDTLNEKLANNNFSIVLIDCDLYDATKYCLEFAYPRLNKNGLIILDDYQNLENPEFGETKAADEFCSSHGTKVILSPMFHIVK